MATVINSVPAVMIDFDLDNAEILADNLLIKKAREGVIEGKIVVFKAVFPESDMIKVKKEILNWGRENSVFPHGESPSKYPALNYHRIDDGTVPSVCPHLFHQYGFNNMNSLRPDLATLMNQLADRLLLIQNAMGQTRYDISLDSLRLKVLQYPEGGGFLAEHTHPKEPQQVGLILSLSKKNQDVKQGAAVFQTPNGQVDTFDYHDIGDVAIFRYDLPHSVSPVNPENGPIDWNKETGKWSVVFELRETHGLSHKK